MNIIRGTVSVKRAKRYKRARIEDYEYYGCKLIERERICDTRCEEYNCLVNIDLRNLKNDKVIRFFDLTYRLPYGKGPSHGVIFTKELIEKFNRREYRVI